MGGSFVCLDKQVFPYPRWLVPYDRINRHLRRQTRRLLEQGRR